MTYTLVGSEDGDWEGLYSPDGILLEEGHSIPIWRVFGILGIDLVQVETDLEPWGRCPGTLGELDI